MPQLLSVTLECASAHLIRLGLFSVILKKTKSSKNICTKYMSALRGPQRRCQS